MTALPTADPDRARDVISAARALLNSDRIADEQELLLTTVVEILGDGAKSTLEIAPELKTIWPGADVGNPTIDAVLQRGVEAGLVVKQDTLIEPSWALTPTGRAETETTRSWYDDAVGRLASQICERAREDFGTVSREQSNLWADLLIDLLTSGIRQIEGAYAGRVARRADGGIAPIGLDAQAMFELLEQKPLSTEISTFLKSCLMGAIDEADPFANEVVNYIATACVLTAVAARRPRAEAASRLGSLKDQRMLLDTPILISLLAPEAEARRVEGAIHAAVSMGADVVVPNHVLEELHEVLDRVERNQIGDLTSALAAGINTKIYRATVNEQLLEVFLDAAEDGKYRSWSEFRSAADGLSTYLTDLGVTVRPHQNLDPTVVDRCREALNEQLESANGGRSIVVIERDAQSMEMVWRRRRRHSAFASGLWPGGWIITTDRQMSPAFTRVDGSDPMPLTLTPAQWATLLSEGADPPAVRDLVLAAASFVREESMLAIAMRYPPKVALDLARSLNGDSVSSTDTRVVQLGLDELLERAAGHPSLSGERLASQVMARRSKRQAAAADAQREQLERSRGRLEEARAAAEAEAHAERLAKESFAREVGTKSWDLAELRSQIDLNAELAPRRAARIVILTLTVVASGLAVVVGYWWTAVGLAAAAMVFHRVSETWANDIQVKHRHLAYALLPALLALVDSVISLRGSD